MSARTRRLRPCPVAVLVVGLIAGPAGAEDCQRGEQLFEQSKTEDSAAQRVALLERSTVLCGRFAGYYALGRERLALGDLEPAAVALETALGRAGEATPAMLALGRLAEVRHAQGRLGEAVASMEAAYARLATISPPRPAPEWLAGLRRQLDVQMASGVVGAGTLSSLFTTASTRGIGVTPRVQLSVQFAYDSAELTGQGVGQVNELRAALAAPKVLAPQQRVRVIGHTDARGTDEYNDRLSLARAASVARALEREQPELAGRIDVEGHGKRELRYPGDDEESHALNRRVEVLIEPGVRTAGP